MRDKQGKGEKKDCHFLLAFGWCYQLSPGPK